MDTVALLEITQTVNGWLAQAHEKIYKSLASSLEIKQKTGRLDLVTNVDREIEIFLTAKIKELMPDAAIVSEEGYGKVPLSMDGVVWFVDPIDGTMNFVKQQDDFAIMIAMYINGKPILGWIMDVAKNIVYYGGPQLGVYRNHEVLDAPADISLNEGLIELSGGRLINHQLHLEEIGKMSSGVRIIGSAGISFIKVLEGKAVGYVSKMKPWDFAAAKVLLESLKILVTTIDGKEIDMLSSNTVLAATATAHEQIVQLQMS